MNLKTSLKALMVAALAFAGCTNKEELTPLAPPQSYLALVDAYNGDMEYYGISHLAGSDKVFFIGTCVIVPKSEMEIDDCCKGGSPKEVAYDADSGRWRVGDELTDIVIASGSLSESFPVYAWFDEKAMTIYASNRQVMTFANISYHEPDNPGNSDTPVEPEKPVVAYQIPKIHITTDNGQAVQSKTEYVAGKIRVEDPSMSFSDVEVFEAPMNIRGRGNSTWGMPKKPYKVKLLEKSPILGISKDKEWVLLANYADKSLLRNSVAMQISKLLGFSWTPEMISVELWFNQEYQGVYTFTEHKKVSKYRVNIDVATAENNTGGGLEGGYYLEFENESINEPTWFKTDRYGLTLMYHDPEYPTNEQQQWLRNYFNDFENTLYALGHDDRGSKNYEDYIDVDSFINYYILQELAKNPDANFRKSTFLTKERGKKLEIYHVWDFDIALGNCDYWGEGLLPKDFLLKNCVWYERLFNKDEAWRKAVKARFNEVLPLLETIPDFIDEQVKLLDGAQDRNFCRWPILGVKVWPNAVWKNTYEEEVEYLKDFYMQRLYWMEEEINKF